MKKVADFMDYAIRSKWIENDAMIAVKVGVAAATVSRWRDGSRIPEDDEALVLAEVLMANPDELLPCVRYWKAKLPETKQVWERLARIAAAAIVVLAVTPHESYADVKMQRAYKGLLFSEVKTRALALLSWIVKSFSRNISRLHTSFRAAPAH